METALTVPHMNQPDAPTPSSAPPDVSTWYLGAARAAFDRLYMRAITMAVAYARRRRLERADAEDVAACACESLVEAFRTGEIDPEPDDEALRRWIEPRVHFRRLDFLKSRRGEQEKLDRLTQASTGEADPATITTDPDMGRLQLRDAVVRAVREMTPGQQRVLMMVREGLDHDEIAAALDISLQSAYNATSRAAKLLRDALGPTYERTQARRLSWYKTTRSKRGQGGVL